MEKNDAIRTAQALANRWKTENIAVQTDAPMSRYTSFKAGGSAAVLVNVSTEAELRQVLTDVAEAGVKASGKVCIGTVKGDLHDIGKNLVKMMLEGKGLEVIDLGTDVAPETFVRTAQDEGCNIICCSALLTTTMGVMGDVVKAAEAAGIRDKVKIMVGGAPVTEAFCQQIGADAYTADAASAADKAVSFCA